MTLEEVDYLFVKDGNKGIKQLWHRSQPVLISLKEDVGQGAADMGLTEGAGKTHESKAEGLHGDESADHIEAKRGLSE